MCWWYETNTSLFNEYELSKYANFMENLIWLNNEYYSWWRLVNLGSISLFINLWNWLSCSTEVKTDERKAEIEIYFRRNCSNPTPQYGGTFCIGSGLDTILCNVSNVTCPGKKKSNFRSKRRLMSFNSDGILGCLGQCDKLFSKNELLNRCFAIS